MFLPAGAAEAFNELNPARSPVLTVCITATATLLFLSTDSPDHGPLNAHVWTMVGVPFFTILVVITALCFLHGDSEQQPVETADEDSDSPQPCRERHIELWKRRHENTNFTQATAVALPLLALSSTVLTQRTWYGHGDDLYFWLPYATYMLQVVLVLAVMFRWPRPATCHSSTTHLGLLCTCFLLAAGIASCKAGRAIADRTTRDESASHDAFLVSDARDTVGQWIAPGLVSDVLEDPAVDSSTATSTAEGSAVNPFSERRIQWLMGGFYLLWIATLIGWFARLLVPSRHLETPTGMNPTVTPAETPLNSISSAPPPLQPSAPRAA